MSSQKSELEPLLNVLPFLPPSQYVFPSALTGFLYGSSITIGNPTLTLTFPNYPIQIFCQQCNVAMWTGIVTACYLSSNNYEILAISLAVG